MQEKTFNQVLLNEFRKHELFGNVSLQEAKDICKGSNNFDYSDISTDTRNRNTVEIVEEIRLAVLDAITIHLFH